MKPRKPWDAPGEPSVLVYEGKHGELIWPFTSTVERRGAMLTLFRFLDEKFDAYAGLDAHEDDPQLVLPEVDLVKDERAMHREWLAAARRGDEQAAHSLLVARQDYEYEEWRVVFLEVIE